MTNSKPVIVIGASGHAKVLIDLLQLSGKEILFCTEVDKELIGNTVLGVSIAGTDDMIDEYSPAEVDLVNGLGSVHIPELRCRIAKDWLAKGFNFSTVIHPSAVVSSTAVLEPGVQIMAGAVIQAAARIGTNSIVNTCASIDHDCVVGAHSHVAPGATLSGLVEIGELCHIGTGAKIIQAVRIGSRVVVGAGSTVIEAVPEDAIVVGTPAKAISKKTLLTGGRFE